jgi:hypothetical protein
MAPDSHTDGHQRFGKPPLYSEKEDLKVHLCKMFGGSTRGIEGKSFVTQQKQHGGHIIAFSFGTSQ